jgi:hypothetical protein
MLLYFLLSGVIAMSSILPKNVTIMNDKNSGIYTTTYCLLPTTFIYIIVDL